MLRQPGQSPRLSGWLPVSKLINSEQNAKLTIAGNAIILASFINTNKKTSLGNPVGYYIKPRSNVAPLLSPSDWPMIRAGFTENEIWVTSFNDDEIFPAGDYPNQSSSSEGLPKWTKNNRNITNTDIVLWYTLCFHHVTRQEDWPIMSTTWDSFELRPYNFFERNPSMNIPPINNVCVFSEDA